MKNPSSKNISTDDPELNEWLDALENIINEDGNDRASFILGKLASKLTESGTIPNYNLTTPFRNSIPVSEEAKMPGDLFMERKIRSLIRWNALAMVLRANKSSDDLGGHIATFSSSATLYDVGFNYFFSRFSRWPRRFNILSGSFLSRDLRSKFFRGSFI